MSDRQKHAAPLLMPQGGVLPEHVLDPSIVRLQPETTLERHTVSATGPLAKTIALFWDSFDRRYFGRINSFSGGGEIPRHHEDFIAETIDVFELQMLDEEQIEALQSFQVLLKEPGERAVTFEEYGIIKVVTPQYFLRNVPRVEMETNLPHVPFEIHLYRDPEDYQVVPYSGIEFDPASDEMLETWSYQTIGEQRVVIRQLVELLRWAQYEEGWTEGRGEWVEERKALFRTKRHKGRFATKEDEEKEKEKEKEKGDPYANLSPEIRQSLGLE